MQQTNKTLLVGDKVSVCRAFSIDDLRQFADLSGDHNPIHIDSDYALNTPFKQNICHGILISGLISGLIGCKMPGEGTIYLAQNLQFKHPLFVNENVTASVEISAIRADKPIVTLTTQCVKDNGDVVITGEAVVKVNPALLAINR